MNKKTMFNHCNTNIYLCCNVNCIALAQNRGSFAETRIYDSLRFGRKSKEREWMIFYLLFVCGGRRSASAFSDELLLQTVG